MGKIQEDIQKRARESLSKKKVDVIIGWISGSTDHKTIPALITRVEDADRLVWNTFCFNNLTTYLTRDEVKQYGKIGIISKGCDNKAIIGLMQECQIDRENLYIIGVFCESMGDNPLRKCHHCEVHTPRLYDELIGEPREISIEDNPFEEVEKYEQMSVEERWQFWQDQFAKCIKCYACRQVCPFCYCQRCIVDKNLPSWIDPSPHPKGNFAWNMIRAFHLSGRCIECEECERACPVNIPLMLLNRKIEKEILNQFNYKTGTDPEAKPPLDTFTEDDDESFIQ